MGTFPIGGFGAA